MKYKDYSPETWQHITTQVEKAMAENPGPYYAAFDADGTLWDMDMGESFFDYQINHCPLKGLPEDPWKYYTDHKEINTREAYLWLAQINEGHSLDDVRQWSKDNFEKLNVPVFPAQQKLITFLKEKGVTVYIVTASIKWAVEPAASLYGLSYDNVFGVETEIQGGKVGRQQKGVITWREGKKDKILEATKGKAPLLASGNTMGDYWLLDCASHVKLAVTGADPTRVELYESEVELQIAATEAGWISHKFI